MKNLLKEKNKHSLFLPVDGSRDQRMAQSLHLSLTSQEKKLQDFSKELLH